MLGQFVYVKFFLAQGSRSGWMWQTKEMGTDNDNKLRASKLNDEFRKKIKIFSSARKIEKVKDRKNR